MPKAPKPASDKTPTKPSQDVALICGRTDDGKGLHVLRKRGTAFEAGVVQPLEDGKPIHGELVTLKQRGRTPVCDVEVHYDATPKLAAAPASTAGSSATAARASSTDGETRGHPAQVASDSYRKNWDTIWKSKPAKKPLLN